MDYVKQWHVISTGLNNMCSAVSIFITKGNLCYVILFLWKNYLSSQHISQCKPAVERDEPELIYRIICYLTGGENELVTGQICLITEDFRFLHLKFFCSPQKPEEMIVYRHPCNSLKKNKHFCLVLVNYFRLSGLCWPILVQSINLWVTLVGLSCLPYSETSQFRCQCHCHCDVFPVCYLLNPEQTNTKAHLHRTNVTPF